MKALGHYILNPETDKDHDYLTSSTHQHPKYMLELQTIIH
jgi:hypothetical protein